MEPLFYSNLFPNILLTKKIYDCTSIQRNLPMFVCKLCANKLDEYVRFRDRCIANDEFLRNALAAFDANGGSCATGAIKMEPEDTSPTLPPTAPTTNGTKFAQCLAVTPMELNCALVAAAAAAASGHQGSKREPLDVEEGGHGSYGSDALSPDLRSACGRVPTNELSSVKHSSHEDDHYPNGGDEDDLPNDDGYGGEPHSADHTDHHQYVCEVCSKSFKIRHHLLVHQHTHVDSHGAPVAMLHDGSDFNVATGSAGGKQSYACPKCAKVFVNKGNLLNHLETHTNEKSYACDICTKTFKYNVQLRLHMRIHTGERPHNPGTAISLSTVSASSAVDSANGTPPTLSEALSDLLRYEIALRAPLELQQMLLGHISDRKKPQASAGGKAAGRRYREHAAGEDCGSEENGGGGARDIGQGESEAIEDERDCQQQRQQQQLTTRTIYSLNMNVCRLCLSEGHGHLQPVFYAQDSPDEILQHKILELTTVEITYAIDFPTSVCMECLTKLDEFTLFRRQCIDNNELLKLKYYELKAVAEGEEYCTTNTKLEIREEDEALQLSQVKKEEEYIQLERSSVIADDQRNGGTLLDAMDDQVPYVEEAAGNEIVIGDGQEEYGNGEQPVGGTKIQYVSEDGTMTEYITAGAIVRRDASPELDEPDSGGGGGGGGGSVGDGQQEIYYTVGTDTYAIPAGATDATGYVPQVFADQNDIECTTIEDHLPEEYVEEVPAVSMTPHIVNAGANMVLAASRGRHDRPFVCKHCKTSFKYEHNYDRHMKNHAKVLYRCGKCSKTFVKLRKCQQHFLKAHSSQRYECDICYRTYSLPTRLENHVIEMHSVNGVYRCDRCQGELFTSYLDFKAHRMRYHPRTDETSAVSAGQVSGNELTPTIIKQTPFGDVVHMEHVLSSNNSYSSPGSPTPSSESEEHPATKDQPGRGKRQLAASRGPVTPRTRTRTNGHNYRTQKVPNTVATTPQHEVILIDDDEQHQHQAQQEGVPLQNGTTTTPTVHRELLQQIEESEANSVGPKMYTCESCPKTFVHLNNLKAHIYAEHDNDKPFKCKVCPISFKTKEILVMHMLLHTQNNGAT
uniref:Protein krueppel n=1 Tax=Anopheles epiroticus TaxID=199890 RepID=A0A182PUK2_9DIPT